MEGIRPTTMIHFWRLTVVHSSVSETFWYHETRISSKFRRTPSKDLYQFKDFIGTNPDDILKLEHLQTRNINVMDSATSRLVPCFIPDGVIEILH